MGLADALIAARQELGAVVKDGQAPQMIGGYKFVSYDTFVAQAESALAKAGLRVVPSIVSVEERVVRDPAIDNKSRMFRTTVHLEIAVWGGLGASDPWVFRWAGTGDDTGDKGLQKAATSAYKYALMKLLMVSGEDDADGTHPTVNEQTTTEAVLNEFPGATVVRKRADREELPPDAVRPDRVTAGTAQPPTGTAQPPTTIVRKRRAEAQVPANVEPLPEQPEPAATDAQDDIPY